MTRDTRLILLIGSAIFFFMGLGLAFDAKHHAEAAAEWERLVSGGAGRGKTRSRTRLLWAYRLGGLAFSGAGVWAAAAARWFPRWLPERLQAVAVEPWGRMISGLLFIALGLMLSSFKLAELVKPPRLPARLADLGTEEKDDWGPRLGSLSGWLVLLGFMALGGYLLSHRL